jgi:hypothetical protein
MLEFAALFGLGFAAFAPQQQANPAPSVNPDALVTSTSITPLTHTATLALIDNRTLSLEPGIQMTRSPEGYSLSTFDGHNVAINTGSEILLLASPVLARVSSAGWDFGNGQACTANVVTVRRQQDDDADSNLKSMQESARKLKSQPRLQPPPPKKLRVRWLYNENPMVTSELFSSEAILQLSHISNNGF